MNAKEARAMSKRALKEIRQLHAKDHVHQFIGVEARRGHTFVLISCADFKMLKQLHREGFTVGTSVGGNASNLVHVSW